MRALSGMHSLSSLSIVSAVASERARLQQPARDEGQRLLNVICEEKLVNLRGGQSPKADAQAR